MIIGIKTKVSPLTEQRPIKTPNLIKVSFDSDHKGKLKINCLQTLFDELHEDLRTRSLNVFNQLCSGRI